MHVLEVWGEFACFTRPELKVERFSYPVITPSAARGIFDAILVKPKEFRWQVTQIEILKPIAYIALRRNEVKGRISTDSVKAWMRGIAPVQPLLADDEKDDQGRTQRQTMALRDVHYRLHAHIVPWPGFESRVSAFDEQFRRRAASGKCYYQPYLGCREFPAWFELRLEDDDGPPPVPVDLDLGLMLYDVFDLSRPGGPYDKPYITVFPARVEGGIMKVPPFESPEVCKPARKSNHAG